MLVFMLSRAVFIGHRDILMFVGEFWSQVFLEIRTVLRPHSYACLLTVINEGGGLCSA